MVPPLARFALIAVLGIAAGVALTVWLGPAALNVIVLTLGVVLAGLLARTFLPARSRPLLWAIALQGGYALWLLFGAVTAGIAGNVLVLVEIAALAGGIVWLGKVAERPPAVFLLVVHAAAILLLVLGRLGSDDLGQQLPLFALHAGLRLAGSYLMLRGLKAVWRRDRRAAPRIA